MSDEAAFLAAIRAAPDDVTLRLVYADWLDERGDPRAAWVRREVRWRAELERLDSAIRPIADRPVDLSNLSNLPKGPHPMDEAGVREEAQALLVEILLALESATEDEQRSMRGLVHEYKSFFWAVTPPDGKTAAETLR